MSSITFILENRENFPLDETLLKNHQSIISMKNHKNEIYLPDANLKTMEKLVKFLEISERELRKIPKKLHDFETSMKDEYSFYWFKELDLSQNDTETAFKLTKTSNLLEIKDLLNVCCKFIASIINGKESHEIRKIFGIKNDFTPEEEESILKENEWINMNYNDDKSYTEDVFKDIPCELFESICMGNDSNEN